MLACLLAISLRVSTTWQLIKTTEIQEGTDLGKSLAEDQPVGTAAPVEAAAEEPPKPKSPPAFSTSFGLEVTKKAASKELKAMVECFVPFTGEEGDPEADAKRKEVRIH